jgi:hypothetical protein
MKRVILAAIVAGFLLSGAQPRAQTSDFYTKVISGTADLIIDSTQTAAFMDGKRMYINNIYFWYDNAANTNALVVDVCRGRVNMATGAAKEFKYTAPMVTSGIVGANLPINITTGRDSTIYFVISGTASDSLYLAVSYKLVN